MAERTKILCGRSSTCVLFFGDEGWREGLAHAAFRRSISLFNPYSLD